MVQNLDLFYDRFGNYQRSMAYSGEWFVLLCRLMNELLSMGVGLKMAIQHAFSATSYWHMARTPAVQFALNNARLKAQGVPCIHDLWCKAQGYDIWSSAPSR
jgi:hypothetical protein